MRLSRTFTPLAAIAASWASLVCCLPFAFLAALGSAGAAVWLSSLRPWLLGVSVLLLVMGFCQLYIGRNACTRRTRAGVLLFWTAVATILFLLVLDRKSTRLNSSHIQKSRMPSSA